MKIAIFTDTYLPQINGVTKTLNKLIHYFEAHNIDYRVFAPQDGIEAYNNKIKRFFSFKFILYPECRVALPNYLSIVEQLKDFRPDIIHVVTPFNLGLCGLKYAKDCNIPLVSSYHTNIPQYLEYFNLKFLVNASWRFFKWFHSQCEKNYCPSKNTMELLAEQGIENLEIWSRGIDTAKFSPQLRNKDLRKQYNIDDKIVFLYVGRMSPEKDLDILMNVARKLNHNFKDSVHFMMVGDGPMTRELKEQAPENMTFTGFLKGNELAEMYASSDVFLFPSSTETYGNVVIEAMASGLPVIACNAGGITDNLVDGYNGLACGVRNEKEFYRAAEMLVNDKRMRNHLAETARNYTLEMNWDYVFQKLVNSYQEVVDKMNMNSKRKLTA
ncbi:MAG: glycosyltransferase family 4 protein [Bacillota bacterium]